MVGTLIVCGVITAIGVGGAIWHSATEEDRAKERIRLLKAENKQLDSAKNYVSGIKSKLTSAKEYLTCAKKDFTNGGHVLDNVPLANSEFTSCISKLDGAIKNAKSLINDFDTTISNNKKEIKKEQAKL